jgi:hypothetical protein
MPTADPKRRKLRPESDDRQDSKAWHSINEEVEGFACSGIAPVNVLPYPGLAGNQHYPTLAPLCLLPSPQEQISSS